MSETHGTGYGRGPLLYRSVQQPHALDLSLTEAEQDLVTRCRDLAQQQIATRTPQAWHGSAIVVEGGYATP